MAATRFYFPAEGDTAPDISPAFNAGWENTGQATRLRLLNKVQLNTLSTLADSGNRTISSGTTVDTLAQQFVSGPIPAQYIGTDCLFSFVSRMSEAVNTGNATLAIVVSVVSSDGATVRGTLYSTFSTGTEFDVTASSSTRIVSQTAVTALTIQTGDRLVIEVGAHIAVAGGNTTFALRSGTNAATDFALTASLTTNLNPWCEFSQDLFEHDLNNFRSASSISAGVISLAERVK